MEISKVEIFFLTTAVLMLGFGYWGICTKQGNSVFDEMAGMIPYFLGLFPGMLIIIFWIAYRLYTYFF